MAIATIRKTVDRKRAGKPHRSQRLIRTLLANGG